MTLPVFRLNYKSCTKAEIWKLCKQRHAPVGRKHRKISKRKCIEALQALDEQATFPFFDLSPELRLMVYPYLLTHDYGQDFNAEDRKPASEAFPQILRASKLCYKEARDILYDRSCLTLAVFYYGRYSICSFPGSRDIDIFIGHGDIALVYKDWSKMLSNFVNLHHVKALLIDSSYPHGDTAITGLSFLLSTIISSFRAGNALKTLTVRYVCERFDEEESMNIAFEHEDRMATAEDVKLFEDFVRSATLMRLTATTKLELLDFHRATWKTLVGLGKEVGE